MSDFELDDLKKMSSELLTGKVSFDDMDNLDAPVIQEPIIPQYIQPPAQQQDITQQIRRVPAQISRPRKVMFDPKQVKVTDIDVQKQPQQSTDAILQIIPKSNIDFIQIGSYNIPKETLFLIIGVVILGIILWYMSQKKKIDKKEEE